jgi:glycosyltransferase involved in cell wall biosynthesis
MEKRLKRSDFIIAISKTTKNDIVERFSYPEHKIAVIYPGAPSSQSQKSNNYSDYKRPYICYLGAFAKNKNVDGMLRIFARCVHEHKSDYDIVLAGKDFCGETFWARLLKELKIEDRVYMKGWVTEEERDAILTNATMLWHFSWYEGFGLPVLEAAAKGIPVLHSNRGAVTEVIKNTDQQIDPANEKEAAAKAAFVLDSEKIRQKWKTIGDERAKEFLWGNSAQKLVEWIEIQ